MTFTQDQIAALSPDPASLKAGKSLAAAANWVLLGKSDDALWGHCKGSGKLPYQTQIDLNSIAFKCSCPSRKFPCKHGLGLLLLYSAQPDALTATPTPDWVQEWLDKRNERATKKSEQAAQPVDEDAQQKRIEAREKKVSAGIEELQTWLKDMAKSGLLQTTQQPYGYWDAIAKRMTDAQATGLANRIKELGDIDYTAEDVHYRLWAKIADLYLLTLGYSNLTTLPNAFQQEVKTQIGFTTSKEEVLKSKGVTDTWLVVNKTIKQQEQLTSESTWLYGLNSKRFALLLQYYTAAQLPEINLMPGSFITGALVFYNIDYSYRVIVQEHTLAQGDLTRVVGCNSVTDTIALLNQSVQANPLSASTAAILNRAFVIKTDKHFLLLDENGYTIRLNCSENTGLKLLSITGGNTAKYIIHTNEMDAQPLAVIYNNQYYPL